MLPRSEGTPGRRETADERADRNWGDLLQELRVLQTGVQILGGLLLTLPFHPGFADLDRVQRSTYLVLVLIATCSTALVLAPISMHRRVHGWQRKDRVVTVGHTVARVVVVLVALLVTGIAAFIFDVVLGRGWGLGVGAGMLALVTLVNAVLPVAVGGTPPEEDEERPDNQAKRQLDDR